MAKQTFTTGQVLTAAQMTSLQQTAMLGGAASAKTASYTLVAADAGTAISMSNASATTITVNTALFAEGDTVQITNLGVGVCTITAGTATVNTASSLALAQYESGTLDFTSTSAAIFIKGAGAAASSGEKSILIPQNSATYFKYFISGALSQDNPVEDTTYYMPIYLPGYAIDRLSIRTGAAFSGTATVRLGLYNASSTTGKPTTVYLDAGTVSCTAASTNYEITVTNTPPAGYYYFAFNMQTSATTSEFAAFNNAQIIPNMYSPTTSTVNTTTYQHVYTETGITGAFATAGTLIVGTQVARFFALRIA